MPTNVNDFSVTIKELMAEFDTWQALGGTKLVVPLQATTASTQAQPTPGQWQPVANTPAGITIPSFQDEELVNLDELLAPLARRLKISCDQHLDGADRAISANSLILLVRVLEEIMRRTNIALPSDDEMSFMDAIEDIRG